MQSDSVEKISLRFKVSEILNECFQVFVSFFIFLHGNKNRCHKIINLSQEPCIILTSLNLLLNVLEVL